MPPQPFREFLTQTDASFGEIMTSEVFSGVERKYGAMFFPKVLFGLFAVCLVGWLAVDGYRAAPDAATISSTSKLDLAFVAGIIVLYLLLAEQLGFVITASVVLCLLFWRLHVRWFVALAVTLTLVPLLYQVFAVSLRVPLPRGWLGW
jgi:putative tricarboxylic transport membrane protein